MKRIYLLATILVSLLLLLSSYDGTKSPPFPSTIATSVRIKYPGFPTDILYTDSVEFCLIDTKSVLGCDYHEFMPVKFILDPKDSVIVQRSNDGRDILINIFSVESIEEISVDNVEFTRYSLRSRLTPYQNNGYVIQKLNKFDYMVMYCVTSGETYKVSFFN